MKKVTLTRFHEWYCFCPYCEALNSDFSGSEFEGSTHVCDSCGKKFLWDPPDY